MTTFKFKTGDTIVITDDIWYALTDGGYFDPLEILDDIDQISQLEEALELVKAFVEQAEATGAIEYA